MRNKCQNSGIVIGVDARFYGPVGKGLGRYTQEVVDRIVSESTDYYYVIFLSSENFNDFVEGGNVRKVLVRSRWYGVSEQIELPYLIWRNRINLMHFPHFNVPFLCPVKFLVTIHDLILTKYPTMRATTLGYFRYAIKNWGYRIVINRAIKRARRIIAVSEFTRDDIVDNFEVDKGKIVISYEGVAELKDGESSGFDKLNWGKSGGDGVASEGDAMCYNIKETYLLYVGNAYPHKNLEGLLDVFKSVKGQVKLVLVGKEDFFYKRVKDYAFELGLLNKRVIFPGYVSDACLKGVYGGALAYVFPSLYEGFGLPPLEAMANGCPVVSSNLASMPEILGDACLYFNPKDSEDFKTKIEMIIGDSELRSELVRKGREQASLYSWENCALITLNVYKEILSEEKEKEN